MLQKQRKLYISAKMSKVHIYSLTRGPGGVTRKSGVLFLLREQLIVTSDQKMYRIMFGKDKVNNISKMSFAKIREGGKEGEGGGEEQEVFICMYM